MYNLFLKEEGGGVAFKIKIAYISLNIRNDYKNNNIWINNHNALIKMYKLTDEYRAVKW